MSHPPFFSPPLHTVCGSYYYLLPTYILFVCAQQLGKKFTYFLLSCPETLEPTGSSRLKYRNNSDSPNPRWLGFKLFQQATSSKVTSLHGDLSDQEKDIADTLVIIEFYAVVDIFSGCGLLCGLTNLHESDIG